MAINESPFQLSGKVAGISFYTSNGKNIARTPGGPSRRKVLTDPKLVRVRENASEFGRTQLDTGALWRECLKLVEKSRDNNANRRLFQLMLNCKNGDALSERGKRSLRIGLQTDDYRKLLFGFEFNELTPFSKILHLPVELDTTQNSVSINGLNPLLHLLHAKEDKQAQFSAAIITATNEWELGYFESSNQVVPIINAAQNIRLDFADPIDKTDRWCFYLFKISFRPDESSNWENRSKGNCAVMLRVE